MTKKYLQGSYRPKNPFKYDGDPTNIIYRSSWELSWCRRCDENTNIVSWSSEETIVPYISPIDNRLHRYFVDFRITVKDAEGKLTTYLIEIKPSSQTKPPLLKEGKKPGKSYISAVETWGVNQAKWKAASEYCRKRGWKFEILTEKELFGK